MSTCCTRAMPLIKRSEKLTSCITALDVIDFICTLYEHQTSHHGHMLSETMTDRVYTCVSVSVY